MKTRKASSRIIAEINERIVLRPAGLRLSIDSHGRGRKSALILNDRGLLWESDSGRSSYAVSWQALERFIRLNGACSPGAGRAGSKRDLGRARPGEMTPHEEFCRPILETLVEMGGRGKTSGVLDCAGEKMKSKGVLKPLDFKRCRSGGKQVRWRISAMWARDLMANRDGRMKYHSPRGVWEISNSGRAWLRDNPHG